MNYNNHNARGKKGETFSAIGTGSQETPIIPLMGFAKSPNLDKFGRLRVSQPYTVFDSKQIHDDGNLFFDDKEISGSGTSSVYEQNRASSLLGVTGNIEGRRVRQSKLRGIYQPGKSQEILITFVSGYALVGIEKLMGYGDDTNGIFLVVKNDGLYIRLRSYVLGSAIDTDIPQSEWNLDKLDGTGDSGYLLDITKAQILFIDFEWLGVGGIGVGFVIDSKIIYVHEFRNSNNIDSVYMSTPNLPIRYEISSDGTGEAGEFDYLESICSSIISEGGQEDTAKTTYISRNGTPHTLANQDIYTPLISIRIQNEHEGIRPIINMIEIIATTNFNYEWRLILNPTIAGTDLANWQIINTSCLEYDITRNNTNIITGGHIIAGGYGSSGAQTKTSIAQQVKGFLTIGIDIAGVSDELVLCVANIEGNGGSTYAGISFNEFL